jgi:hypothetical protein
VEKTTYPNPAVVTASKNMVCIVGHAGTGAKNAWETNHGSREVKRGAEKVKMCKHYTGIVCSDHVEFFKQKVPKVFGNKTFNMPHHVYFSPNGEELFRSEGVKNPQELSREFAEALGKVGGSFVTKDDYDGAKAAVADGQALVKKDEIKKALDVFTKLTKHKNGMLHVLGTKEIEALEAHGSARVEAALQTMQNQGGEEQAKKELKKVAEEYAPLACSKKAQEVLKLMSEKGR